jgi:hypothetical protein
LVWKYTIWQPWLPNLEIVYLTIHWTLKCQTEVLTTYST